MRSDKRIYDRSLGVERLEPRHLLSAQVWDMAADFSADFVGNLPQHNPNGVWSYLGTDGATSSLVSTTGDGSSGPNTFGVGGGWADAGGVPSYARSGAFGFPPNGMAGHGPDRILFTAPAALDLGGVEITGYFTQATFEPTRQMEMRIYKNNFAEPVLTVDANFTVQNTVLSVPATQLAMKPGDTLKVVIDGGGPQGSGVATFSSWDVVVHEIQLGADYNANGVVDAADYTVWRDHVGATGVPGSVPGDGTTTGGLNGVPDGIVDQWDYSYWKQQYGTALNVGGAPLVYHPAAIIVQTSGVTLPDGSPLDITGTQTQGLQEAINYSAAQGWDIFVLPGTYTLNAHLDFPALQLRSFRLQDVTLNFTSSVTDFGIRFDSTMLTNLYWKGGAINAPSATNGIIYQPRTPHPLDGIKYGTIGVVDSAFQFNIPITAATYAVTMNTLNATINDLTFYFGNVTSSQIHYVGSGFAPYNIFEAPRIDDAIPFDLLSTAGRVTVVPPTTDITAGLPGTVFLPDGSTLDVTGTKTFGLQEAFNYAAAHNLDVVVFGRGVRNSAPFTNLGLYNLSSSLTVGDLTGRMYHIYGVTFNYTVPGDSLVLGDLVNSTFELTGQLVSGSATNVLLIRPNGPGIQNSLVRVQATVGGSASTDVRIDPSLASIRNSTFILHEVNTGYDGIKIMNPSVTTEFSGNLVRSLHTHAPGDIGVQIGEGATNSSLIHANTFEVRMNTDGVSSYAALQVWAAANTINVYAGNSGFTYGLRFESSSHDNTIYVGGIQAGTAVVNLGTNNMFLAAGAGAGSFATELDAGHSGTVAAALLVSPSTPVDASAEEDLLLLALIGGPSTETSGTDASLRTQPYDADRLASDMAFALDDLLPAKVQLSWPEVAA
jgi:hypothetical protein